MSEKQHQEGVANYLKQIYPNIKFTICPANTINPWHGKQNKAMGYGKGCPDMLIFARRGGFSGLFIEMKVPEIKGIHATTGRKVIIQRAGKISGEQQEWIDYLNKEGYKAVVCYGSQAAYKVVDSYLRDAEKLCE